MQQQQQHIVLGCSANALLRLRNAPEASLIKLQSSFIHEKFNYISKTGDDKCELNIAKGKKRERKREQEIQSSTDCSK